MRRHEMMATATMPLLGIAAQGAQAQTSRPPGWEFSVTPYGWFGGLSGSTHTPGFNGPFIAATFRF